VRGTFGVAVLLERRRICPCRCVSLRGMRRTKGSITCEKVPRIAVKWKSGHEPCWEAGKDNGRRGHGPPSSARLEIGSTRTDNVPFNGVLRNQREIRAGKVACSRLRGENVTKSANFDLSAVVVEGHFDARESN
jgi:hypothetical protein